MKKRPPWRPSEYSEEKLDLARAYVDGGWEERGDVVPTAVGLALAMEVATATVYNWATPEKPDFLEVFTRVAQIQHQGLVNRGLIGDFNPAITKMLLTKHGYSDKQEIDHQSSDGSMTPPTRIELVPLPNENE